MSSVLSQIKSVNEFLGDLHDAVKDTPWPKAIGYALPWASYIGEALADAVGPIKFITTLWQKGTAVTDVNEQGILIGRLAFQRSVQQAFQAVVVHIAPLGKISSQFVDRDKSPEQGVTFDAFTLESAAAHPFFVRSRDVLEKFLQSIDMDETIRARVVSEVSRRFVNNFSLILGHRDNKERFHEFREMLKTGVDVKSLLDQHAAYQRWLFEEQRVLNYEPFALQHTYIETDCGELSWKEYQELVKKPGTSEPGRDPFAEESTPRQAAVQRIIELVKDPKFKECIVIQGHAGAGKSSLTKRLCCELLDEGFRPIRIELKDLDVTSTDVHISELLPMAVKLGDEAYDSELVDRFLPRNSSLEEAIKGDLRSVDSQKISNYVLILDAWDEVSIGASEGYQQAIDKLLHRLRDQYLSQRLGCHVRVILSGRPSDAVMQSGFLKDDSVILTMRPFVPDQLKDFVKRVKQALKLQPVRLPANWEQEGVWARWSLDNTSKTDPVEQRFREAFEKRAKKEVTPDEALEILGLPLLCQLALRLIAEWEGDAQRVLDNTTVLYRSLVDMLGMGAKLQDQNLIGDAPHLGGDELRNLLRSTAEAMSVRGVESISRAELEARIGEDCDELERRVEKLARDQVLSRLMVSFFFKGGHKDLGCEFSHKSFREYLFAEQIVEELRKFGQGTESFSEKPVKDYWRDFDERDPRFVLSRRMAELLGPNWLTNEVGQHLTRLIGWEIARSAGREPYAIPERLRCCRFRGQSNSLFSPVGILM